MAKKGKNSIDDTDFGILETLRKDGRASLAKIAKEIGLSKVAVNYRLKRLISRGIIKSFFPLIDSRVYGITLSVVFDITVEPHFIQSVAEKMASFPEVVRVYELTSTPQLHVHALFRDNEQMEQFLRQKLYRMNGISNVTTGIIIKRYKTDLTLTV